MASTLNAKTILIRVETSGVIPELHCVTGPIRKCRVDEKLLYRLVRNGRIVYELNPADPSQSVRLNIMNMTTRQFEENGLKDKIVINNVVKAATEEVKTETPVAETKTETATETTETKVETAATETVAATAETTTEAAATTETAEAKTVVNQVNTKSYEKKNKYHNNSNNNASTTATAETTATSAVKEEVPTTADV